MALRPINPESSAGFVSTYDEALDKERIIDAELEKNDELRDSIHIPDDQKREIAWVHFGASYAAKAAKDPSRIQ